MQAAARLGALDGAQSFFVVTAWEGRRILIEMKKACREALRKLITGTLPDRTYIGGNSTIEYILSKVGDRLA